MLLRQLGSVAKKVLSEITEEFYQDFLGYL